MTVTVPREPEPVSAERKVFIKKIRESWGQVIEGFIATGRALIDAKEKLTHGQFEAMVRSDLPFGPRTARMLMAVAAHPVLSNRNHGSVLPPSWRTLYELSQVPEERLLPAIESRRVHPEMQRFEARMLVGATHVKEHRSGPSSGSYMKEPTVKVTLSVPVSLWDAICEESPQRPRTLIMEVLRERFARMALGLGQEQTEGEASEVA